MGRSWVDLGRPRGVKMRAAEGLKRSYVEMILSGEIDMHWGATKEKSTAKNSFAPRPVLGVGETVVELPPVAVQEEQKRDEEKRREEK